MCGSFKDFILDRSKMRQMIDILKGRSFDVEIAVEDYRHPDRRRPRIAVLMPIHNGDEWIDGCLTALSKNLEPHDLVIVDDGSERPLLQEQLGPYQFRTILIRLESNIGIVGALNIGLSIIQSEEYEYVARQDVDDLSFPSRLSAQLELLDSNSEIALCGSASMVLNDRGSIIGMYDVKKDHSAIVKALPFGNPFVHTSLFIKCSALTSIGFYNNRFRGSEDYELTFRASKIFQVANIGEPLVGYRVHESSISSNRLPQAISSFRVALTHFDARDWRSYAGISKKILLMYMPRRIIIWLRTCRLG